MPETEYLALYRYRIFGMGRIVCLYRISNNIPHRKSKNKIKLRANVKLKLAPGTGKINILGGKVKIEINNVLRCSYPSDKMLCF
jgi:hypothetical protein